jgi:hypothetical protein
VGRRLPVRVPDDKLHLRSMISPGSLPPAPGAFPSAFSIQNVLINIILRFAAGLQLALRDEQGMIAALDHM